MHFDENVGNYYNDCNKQKGNRLLMVEALYDGLTNLDKEILRKLVEAAKHWDADAFSQLYAHYYKALYKTAYYLIGNAHDAEDTVMDTVTDMYRGMHQLRAPEAFEGWMYKILYNKARRKRGVNVYKAASELHENIEGGGISAEMIGDHTDLMRALDTLSKEERMIVALSVCEGYKSAEISAMLSMNHNTVRSKQMRALAKLRGLLEPEERELTYGR